MRKRRRKSGSGTRKKKKEKVEVIPNGFASYLLAKYKGVTLTRETCTQLYDELVSVLQKTHPIITEVPFLITTLDRQTNAEVMFIEGRASTFRLNERLVSTSVINPSWVHAPKSISALDFVKIVIHELGHVISDVNEHHGKQWQSNCIALARLLDIGLENPSTFCDSQEKRDVMGGFAGYFGCKCRRYFRDIRPSKQQMSKNIRTCGKCKEQFEWYDTILDKRKHATMNEDTAPPEGMCPSAVVDQLPDPKQCDNAKDSNFDEIFEDLFGCNYSSDESSDESSDKPLIKRISKRPRPSAMFQQSPNPSDTYTMQSERKDKKGGVIHQDTQGKSRGKLRVAWAVTNMDVSVSVPVSVNIIPGKQGVCDGSVIKFPIRPSNNCEFVVENANVDSNGDIHCFLRKRCCHDDNATPSAPPSEKPTYMSARCNGNVTFGNGNKRGHERFVFRKGH